MLASVTYRSTRQAIMLHAFARNKSRAYSNYIRVRGASGPRVSAEDEITSIVFGPLDFLSAPDHWALWTAVLRSHASLGTSGPLPGDFIADFAPTDCVSAFWPRKDGIEPDLLIRFSDDQGNTRSLLIELKWDAGISGADQLHKQWLHYHSGEHDNSVHVFIAKRMGDLPADRQPWACVDERGTQASRLRGVRWHEFRHEIVKLGSHAGTSAPLKRWCALASAFLEQVKIRPFVGFDASMLLAEALPPDPGAVPFWTSTTST